MRKKCIACASSDGAAAAVEVEAIGSSAPLAVDCDAQLSNSAALISTKRVMRD
jgi:hypothetical protein